MRRISDEDGINAGFRNIGRYALFMIPAALGGAACLWIAAAFGWIELGHAINMERRSLQAVGVTAPPKEPIKLVRVDSSCLKFDDAYVDGDDVITYVKNTCDRWLDLPNFAYRTQAGDGTTIISGRWAFSGIKSIGPHERREQKIWLDGKDYNKLDPRTATILVEVID
jgi:hypothetical protein